MTQLREYNPSCTTAGIEYFGQDRTITRILLSFFITILWTPDCSERSLHPLPDEAGSPLITDSHRPPISAREHTERLTTSRVTAQSDMPNQLWVNCYSKLFSLVWPGAGPQLCTDLTIQRKASISTPREAQEHQSHSLV